MIARYTNPAMGAIWSEQRKYQTWLDVELAATDALADAGLVPREDAKTLREKARFDVARIEEIEQTTQHDVIAFTTSVAEHVGPAARWLHFGLTSSDVLDTALALQMRAACDLLLQDVDALLAAIQARALEHRRTPMIGRTHGVHAEPMTFGVKLALWHAEMARSRDRLVRAREAISVGKLSGAVGMFAHLDPAIEAAVCRRLGLEPAPVSSQVIQRDRHAELLTAMAILAASLEKFALEIRGLQKTEIGEVEEPFGKGQKGSSAMPHKRNPIGCEQVVGLARLIRANAMAALENVALWHERDISHSSVERVIVPDSFIALDHMLRRFTRIVTGWSSTRRGCWRISADPAAWCSRGRCCSSWPDTASRASRRTSGCSGTRCGRSASSAISRHCCWRIPTSPAPYRARPSSARSIWTRSSGTWMRSSRACSATRRGIGWRVRDFFSLGPWAPGLT